MTRAGRSGGGGGGASADRTGSATTSCRAAGAGLVSKCTRENDTMAYFESEEWEVRYMCRVS